MKKRLEAELLSIAHRILKLKNKSEVDQLYLETQKLYEALTVLKFYGDNYEQAKSEVNVEDWEAKISSSLEEKPIETPIAIKEPVVVAEPKATENVTEIETKKEDEQKIVAEIASEVADENLTKDQIEETAEEAPVDVDFGAIFEMAAENPGEIEEEASLDHEVAAEVQIEEIQAETKQISFEDLLGENYSEPVFVKPNEITKPASKTEVIVEAEKSKSKSLNDRLAKTINIGLNDRMGFVKHLFSESNEDFNRVLSQLNTFTTFEEARDFIEEIIKPDYNNWEGVDDYAERFIEIVEKRFD
jgi:hypothetical protein